MNFVLFIYAPTDIDFEAFLITKPDHIREAIPSLAIRIKFENLYSKFLSGLEEAEILDTINEKNAVSLYEMDAEPSFQIDQIITIPPKKNEVIFSSSTKEKTSLRTAEVFNSVVCK